MRPAVKDNCMLNHDKAPRHFAFSINQLHFGKENAPVDPQCSYSPDLFPETSPFVPKFKEKSQMIPFRNNRKYSEKCN